MTQSRHRTELMKEYRDPLAYMDQRTIRHLRIRYVIIALLCTLLGCVIWAIFIFDKPEPTTDTRVQASSGGFALVALALYLPPYGIYRFFTIKRSIIAYRRRQLARNDIPSKKNQN